MTFKYVRTYANGRLIERGNPPPLPPPANRPYTHQPPDRADHRSCGTLAHNEKQRNLPNTRDQSRGGGGGGGVGVVVVVGVLPRSIVRRSEHIKKYHNTYQTILNSLHTHAHTKKKPHTHARTHARTQI